MSFDEEIDLISDLACECCVFKIERLVSENDQLKRDKVKLETQISITSVDLKEKDSEINNLLQQYEEMKASNTMLLSNIGCLEEKFRILEESSRRRDEYYEEKNTKLDECNEVKQDNQVIDAVKVIQENQIKDLKEENYKLNNSISKLKHDLELVKDEAQQAVHEFMMKKNEFEELQIKYDGLQLRFEKNNEQFQSQQISLAVLNLELTEIRKRELNWKSRCNNFQLQSTKLSNELLATQSNLSELKRMYEIQKNSYEKNEKQVTRLQSEFQKLKNKMLQQDNQNNLQATLKTPLIFLKEQESSKIDNCDNEFQKKIDVQNLEIKKLKQEICFMEEKLSLEKEKLEDKTDLLEKKELKINIQENEIMILKKKIENLNMEKNKYEINLKEKEFQINEKNDAVNQLRMRMLILEEKIEQQNFHLKEKETSNLKDKNQILLLQNELELKEQNIEDFAQQLLVEKNKEKHILIRIPDRRTRFIDDPNTFKREGNTDKDFKEILEKLRECIHKSKVKPLKNNVILQLNSLVKRQQSVLRLIYTKLLHAQMYSKKSELYNDCNF